MAFFDELGAKLTKTGQMAAQKTNDLAETAKLNMRTGELNKVIQEQYARLGERYFALRGSAPPRLMRSWSPSAWTSSASGS